MASQQSLTRRRFLGQATGAAGLALALPYLVPQTAFGANERVVTGHIGVGGQGGSNLGKLLANAAAVCDLDKDHLAKAQQRVAGRDGKRKCDAYGDFRNLLDRKDIDAVVVSTPDHWHALPTVRACEAGKDVYCEKPLSLTIAEGRAMVEAARRHKRIVQTGSQQRSDDKFRLACELVRSGRLGKIERITVGIPGVNFAGPPVPDSDPPPQLDYDFWLGPAPKRPYNEKRVHYLFRFFWDYSGGQMTNWGAHHLDIAQWGMGTDETGPIEIEGEAKYHAQHWYEVPEQFRVTYKYANGATVVCGQGLPGGTTFEGAKGKIHVNRGLLKSEPADLIAKPLEAGDVHLYASKNHHANWLESIKTRKPTICDVAIGHRSATVCHLGNIAIRVGRKIKWDPVAEQIIGDEEANRMLSRPYRAPWKL
ncbi:MAG: Gfo/Idh/MocA family protein [Pirellulales bacterium]